MVLVYFKVVLNYGPINPAKVLLVGDQAKMSLLSHRNFNKLFLVFLSSRAEMTTSLSVLPSNNDTFLVSSASFAQICCSGSSSEGSLFSGFSLLRLCKFFYPGMAVSSATRAWSWSPYSPMRPLVEGSFI